MRHRHFSVVGSIQIVTECDLCTRKSGIYDTRLACCRARSIASLPTQDGRRSMIESLVKKWGEREALEDQVKSIFIEEKTRREKLKGMEPKSVSSGI